jgi:hypothetical protein
MFLKPPVTAPITGAAAVVNKLRPRVSHKKGNWFPVIPGSTRNLNPNHKHSQIATPILRYLLKIHGVNSIQLRSSYRTYKLPVYNSPREYISVFAVRANAIAFGDFCERTFGLSHITIPGINPRATDILHLTAQ